MDFRFGSRIRFSFPCGLAVAWLLLLTGCGRDQSSPVNPISDELHVAEPVAMLASSTSDGGESGEVPSADGVLIRYEVHGAGEPAVLFIHGWCCNRGYWQPQLEHFAKSRKVVAVDLAGHGGSDRGRKDWTMAAFGADVAAVVKQLDLKQVVLVGHSMGGPVMLEAAPLLEGRVTALIGVDTLTDPDEQYTPEQMAVFQKPFEADFAQGMRNALRHENDFFTAKTDPALIERIVAGMSAAPRDVGIGAFQGMLDFANERQRAKLAEVNVPLTCINAKRDPDKVRAGQKYAPQFEVVTLDPNAGHFLMMEQPENFNTLLEQTLAK